MYINIYSDQQVTFIKRRSYFTSVTGKRNSLRFNPLPIFHVTVPLQLPVTAIINAMKSLLVATTKSNQLHSGTVTPLHFISDGHRYFKV